MEDPKLDEMYRLTQDNNRMLHKMRRSMWWGRAFTLAWWLIVLAVSGYAYYAYAQPYVDRLTQLYAQLQGTNAKAQNISAEISSFFGTWSAQHTSTSTSTTTH